MAAVASKSEEYVSIAAAARKTGITETRIRYWLLRDPKFPQGRKAGRPVVKASAVAEYFRRLDTVEEVSGPLTAGGEYDDEGAEQQSGEE